MSQSISARIDRRGPALVAVVVGILCVAYLTDAVLSSTRIHNLIMLVPLTGAAVLMVLIVLAKEFLRARRETPAAGSADAGDTFADDGDMSGTSGLGVAAMMLALLVYVCAIPWIGLEISSAVFMAFCLVVQGERRWWFVAGFSVIYALGITWALINLARVPVTSMLM